MILGWADIGIRERLFAIERSLVECIERVDAMHRCRYDPSTDELAFRTGSGSTIWERVRNVNVNMLAARLRMTVDQLRNWVMHDPVRNWVMHDPAKDADAEVVVVAEDVVGDVKRIVAEADALWDALAEC